MKEDNPYIPRVVSAAMLMDDGLIVTGVRHFSPDMRATLKRIYGMGFKLFGKWIKKPYHMRVLQQGFIDSKGKFLDRESAWKVADRNGQIFLYDPTAKGHLVPQAPNQGDTETLFSENLY